MILGPMTTPNPPRPDNPRGAWTPEWRQQGAWQPAPAYGAGQFGAPGQAGGPGESRKPGGRNTLGIIGLVVAVLGAVLSCVPGIAIVGWILLPIGFVLGVIGLTASDKPKGTAIGAVVVSIVGTLVAAAAFLVMMGSALDEVFGGDTTVTSSESGTAAGSGAGAGASDPGGSDEVGTRANPASIGDTLANDEWRVVVNSVTRDGTDAVMGANMFNDPPPPGSEYALINLTATYLGSDSAHVEFLSVAFVTDEGNVINSFDHAAVVPDPLGGELYTGATATGNVDLAIPTDAGGLLRIGLGLLGDEVFVKIG